MDIETNMVSCSPLTSPFAWSDNYAIISMIAQSVTYNKERQRGFYEVQDLR